MSIPPLLLGLAIAISVSPGNTAVIAAEISDQPLQIAQVPTTASTLLFVNPSLGNDNADGSQRSPFRTITHALRIAPANSMILLAPGTYSTDSGETFPLVMKPGVGIQGNPGSQGQGIIIRGGGDFLSPTSARQNIAILGTTQATLVGVTVTNPNPRGYGLWIESSHPTVMDNTFTDNNHDGISVVGRSAPLIQDNLFSGNGANGITVFGSSQPQIRNNRFEQTGYAINVADQATPQIIANQIRRNRSGVVVQGQARPVMRGNLLEGQTEDGIVAIAQAQPDLGTATEPGNNRFQNNGRYDVNAASSNQRIAAAGNQLSRPTIGQLDLRGTVAASTPIQPVPSPAIARPTAPRPVAATPTPPARPTSPPAARPIPVIPPPATASPTAAPAAIEIPVIPAPGTAPVRDVVIEQPSQVASGFARTANPMVQAIINPAVPSSPAINSALPRPRRTIAVSQPPVLPSILLPVPDGNAPIGNIGDMPTVMVSRNPLNRPSRLAATRSATNLGLRYRVVVEAEDESTQARVRSLIPGAFRTYANGRVMMQAGAYSDRANADETVQLLTNNGMRAVVQPIE